MAKFKFIQTIYLTQGEKNYFSVIFKFASDNHHSRGTSVTIMGVKRVSHFTSSHVEANFPFLAQKITVEALFFPRKEIHMKSVI